MEVQAMTWLIRIKKARLKGWLAGAACVLALAPVAVPAPLQAQAATTGAFRDLAMVDARLKKGVTTKADVRRELGIPNGSGRGLWAYLGPEEREIWYYEDVAVTGMRSAEGTMTIDMRQQIFLVLFKGEYVDGYLWTSNAGAAEVR
jgi:hypothetical protein